VVETLQGSAERVAQQRGSSELQCPEATTQVLGKEAIQEPQGTGWYEPPHRAAYTVGVSGCGKQASYSVTCDDRTSGCVANTPEKALSTAPPELADILQPSAEKAAQQHGSSELDCPAVKTKVTRDETIEEPQGTGWYDPPHRALYTVAVSGCGKSTTYLVSCDDRKKGCAVGGLQEKAEGAPPDLADKLLPGAVAVAQKTGSSELDCPAATTRVLRQETIQEPQGTGWYDPPHRALYTVAVSGCGKSTTYLVSCDAEKNSCAAGGLHNAAR
jgi:hypothetical protein